MKINFKFNHKKILFNSMVGMTWGFIASLVSGTLIGLIGMYSKKNIFIDIKHIMSYITPLAIGVGVGIKMQFKPLQILGLGLGVFLIGHSTLIPSFTNGVFKWAQTTSKIGFDTNGLAIGLPGDVFGAWIGSLMISYIYKTFLWDTFLDIIIVPIVGILLGVMGSLFITYITTTIVILIEWLIHNSADKVHWAGILLAPVIGILMGLALSLPTSSAAIAFAINLHGDAATAAIAGTAAQMLSFGIMTYLSTKSVSKSLAVGFGTTMIQMNNFIKKPQLLIIPALVSGITALVAVGLLPLAMPIRGVTSGMGSCALYGQIFTMHDNGWTNTNAWLNVVFIQLLLPILLTLPIGYLSIKRNWIKKQWLEIKKD